MYYFDPMYFLFVAPAILLALWAQAKVKWAYAMASQILSSSGHTGASAARRVLEHGGIYDVGIEQSSGFLSDHYDPRQRVLRLSPEVYHGRSLASLGIAAHEAGHALQHSHGYAPLAIRNGLVPLASVGSNLSMILIMIGLFLDYFHSLLGWNLLLLGIGLFSVTVFFQVVNLPVEFNASSRARESLLALGLVDSDEDRVVKKVLSAAAMTYVAATITAILTLLYYLFRAGLLGGRRDD
ncbi:MAG: zinc metallopeptidase [Planctomycetes bacterium]|nr:zinc metallopeptidase [Planctomycetota bacterium]